jgi:hypothetical protein
MSEYEYLFEPVGYVDVELPPEDQAVAVAVGFGGVARPIPARLMMCNKRLFGWRAPVNFGIGRDSQAERASYLQEIAKEVSWQLPDRLIPQKNKSSLLTKILGRKDEVMERNRPYAFWMAGGSLEVSVTPYGWRPDKLAMDYEIWHKVIDSDIAIVVEQMKRRRAAQRSLLIGGRSVGSHEVCNAYAEYQLKHVLRPNYTLTLLPVFESERLGLAAYLSLLKEFGLPRDEVLIPFSSNRDLGSTKSDIAFLTTFLCVSLVSENPDIVTILERVRQRSMFAGVLLKMAHIPVRTIERKGKVLWVIPVYSVKERHPEMDEETQKIVDRLISECYLEISEKIEGRPVAIFLYGPFQKQEAQEIESNYHGHYKGCDVLVGQGRTFGTGNLVDVYCVGLYVLNDKVTLPPYLASATGIRSLDEASLAQKSYMRRGYEILSKFLGLEVSSLFRRDDEC